MKAIKGLCVSLVILDEPTETGGPCEGSFDDPAARQQHEAALDFQQLDDLEVDAVPGGNLRRGRSV